MSVSRRQLRPAAADLLRGHQSETSPSSSDADEELNITDLPPSSLSVNGFFIQSQPFP